MLHYYIVIFWDVSWSVTLVLGIVLQVHIEVECTSSTRGSWVFCHWRQLLHTVSQAEWAYVLAKQGVNHSSITRCNFCAHLSTISITIYMVRGQKTWTWISVLKKWFESGTFFFKILEIPERRAITKARCLFSRKFCISIAPKQGDAKKPDAYLWGSSVLILEKS